MFYNVAQLLKEGEGASRHYHIAGELRDIDENNPGPVPIEGEVTLVRTPLGILATGTVRLRLVQTCRRCLEPIDDVAELTIEEEYVPSIDILTGLPAHIPDDTDPENIIDEHHILDLTEALRQSATIEAGGAGLCRPDCKGLCPSCGSNLNLGACDCDRTPLDARLAVLSRLLESEDDNNES